MLPMASDNATGHFARIACAATRIQRMLLGHSAAGITIASAVTIETVICRHGLAMLQATTQGDFHGHFNPSPRTPSACWPRLRCSRRWHDTGDRAQDAKTPDYEAIVASPTAAMATGRPISAAQPAKMLAFTGVKAGMKVLDMEASAGYSTELLARAVGPTGAVYAQDSAAVIERFVKDKFDIRAQKPVMKNVVHVVRNFDDPIPPDVGGLDLITFFFAYHDMTYMPVDRAVMNQKMFAALKPGGFLDHRRPFGTIPAMASTVAKTAASDRGERAAPGDRGGRLQAGGAKPISCAIPKIRGTRRCSVRRFRSTSSC